MEGDGRLVGIITNRDMRFVSPFEKATTLGRDVMTLTPLIVTADVQMRTPVGDWLIIDAILDNTVAVERVGGDSREVEFNQPLRSIQYR